MSVIKTVVHSTKRFSYNPYTRVFSAEASDFQRDLDGRIYVDAADQGFWLMSETTGVEKPFVRNKTHIDRDGDVSHWEYIEIEPRTGQRVMSGLRVHVFND